MVFKTFTKQGAVAAVVSGMSSVPALTYISRQVLTFDDTPAMPLPVIPALATRADITLIADGDSDNKTVTAYFSEGGAAPSNGSGKILGHAQTHSIYGAANIAAFKIIGAEAGRTHILQISYYG